MEAIRTDESRFADLPDFPYEPQYRDWNGLRVAHIDVSPDDAPEDAPVALLMHGEPTWSYLYRKMIPPLLAAGYRCVAPDHVGFGRSDKPVDDNFYVIERHCERTRFLIEDLDLQNITVFVQDWGGPTGLRQAVDMPDRFERLVIMNTWLHHADYAYSPAIRFWRESATNPMWLGWTGGDLPCGAIVAGSIGRPDVDRELARRAYDAPFESAAAKAGARRFPWCIPLGEPEAGNAADQERCFNALLTWAKPVHFIFGDRDPIFTADWGRNWSDMIAGSTFDTVEGASHFLQEEAGEEIVAAFLARRG